MDLADFRNQIDEIDQELMALFRRRMETVEQIAAYKEQHGLPVYDPQREEEKRTALLAQLPPALRDDAGALLTCLFTLSKAHQSRHAAMPRRCGLLGRRLAHSYSPAIHARLGSYEYRLFQREPEELEVFLREGAWDGLNVTIPYKQAAAACCDRLSPLAQRLGSVNTLVRCPDGSLYGDNTDAWGFGEAFRRLHVGCTGKKALVLGSGGASVTVQAVLRQLGAQVVVISRTGADNYENLDRHRDAAILINATPVGMYPDNGESPLALDRLPRLEAVFDLIYNPARTRLLLEAEARGIPCSNGLTMLVAQAAKSSEQFTGQAISQSVQDTIVAQVGAEMENWVLIGMPGCGKPGLVSSWPSVPAAPLWMETESWRSGPECPFRCSLAATGRRPSGTWKPRCCRIWERARVKSSPPAVAASPGRKTTYPYGKMGKSSGFSGH